jgi:hypothetical protein
VIWIIYLVVGWAALAWTAVGLLLPVAGLGMAVLSIGLPGLPRLPGLPDRPVPAVAGSATTGATATGATRGAAAVTGGTAADSSAATGGSGPVRSGKRRLSPLFVAGHGAFAVTTMLLVLLAALGVGAG